MQVGFFFWPYTPELVRRMGEAAERYGYDMIGVADTPGNAMDPWVAATLVAQCTSRPRIAQCVTNLASRHPAVTAAAAASLDLLAPGRTVLGIGTGHSGTRNIGVASGGTPELDPGAVESWQIAALDCNRDGAASRRRIGAILAFMAGGYILQGDLAARGVPADLHEPIAELRRRYSTRPGDADAALVDELGLFDYLAGRFAIYGTAEQCREQMLAAREAGLQRVMFTVSLAADPVQTVELFGAEVLPALR